MAREKASSSANITASIRCWKPRLWNKKGTKTILVGLGLGCEEKDTMDRKEPQVLIDKIARHDAFKALEKRIRESAFPIDLAEAENSFLALIVAALRKITGKSFFIVLPTDHEAQEFSNDLAFFGIESGILPWWNTAAYRPAAVRSRVFGERASVFADLASKAPGVFVASHRAFITPAPPKAYFSKLLIQLRHGQAFQPEAIADRLGEYGYLRVPRIALPGEFAQRGEVLDVFMPGDAQAIRIQFRLRQHREDHSIRCQLTIWT